MKEEILGCVVPVCFNGTTVIFNILQTSKETTNDDAE